jgi:hypothetical protein
VEHARTSCLRFSERDSARLTVRADMAEHSHSLGVELAVFLDLDTEVFQASILARQASAIAAIPVQLPGSGPSASTNSISGCAHSAEPK